ncbi:MAG TPA: hypothetical protein VFG03_12985, partial [Telluria sp.]|nr:hypothetical protein [Telluria sp.]
YKLYVDGHADPVGSVKTNPAGMANGTSIGPLRTVVAGLAPGAAGHTGLSVAEAGAKPEAAVLRSVP